MMIVVVIEVGLVMLIVWLVLFDYGVLIIVGFDGCLKLVCWL